jgi:MerR family mercuric resistance operon transcriptional regulator
MRVLTIGKAARAAGVGVETIRFYERQKLIERPLKPHSGIRHYPAEVVSRIRFIKTGQQLGFTLREIHELLALRADPDADCSDLRKQATAKLEDVRHKIEQLQQIAVALEALITACPGRGHLQVCSILDALTGKSADHATGEALVSMPKASRRRTKG